MTAPEPDPPDREDALYDSYLDGALAGTAEEPVAFLARHGGVSPEVRARIEALHRLSRRVKEPPRRPGPARVAEPGLPRVRFGEFRLLRRIGAGGMGVVYEAEQESLGRLAAVKVLRPDLLVSPEARERFRREAQAVARLRHPHIVSVLSAGEEEGTLWIALDLVAGRGLNVVIREEVGRGSAVAPARAARLAARIARALEYAHARGVVHRDVKPANILVGPGDEPFLLDFGVARDADAGPTLAGPFVGSIPWAPPEQLAGRSVDGRADVYGLGATLYQCLTGRVPFEGDTVDRAIHRILHEDAVPPGRLRSGIPRDLEAVVLKALEKDPDRRYPGAGAFAEDLEAVLEFRPVRARPPGPARRLRAWARLHPAWAAGAATAALAAAVLAGSAVAREAEARERVRLEALDEVAAARAHLRSFREQRDAAAGLEKEVGDTRDLLESRWLPPETDAALDGKEEALRRRRHDRETAFHEVLDRLRRAERLDPGAEGVDPLRAELYLEKWRDAETARDRDAAEIYRALVAESDPDGALSRAAFGKGSVSFRTDAPGAEVHLFRFREEAEVRTGGERRLVPVPRGTAPVAPGSFAFRVARGAGELRPGDLVLEVAGRADLGGAWIQRGGGGLERGDRMVSVDGTAIEDIHGFEEAFGLAEGSGPAREHALVLDHAGKRVELSAASLEAGVGDLRALAQMGGLPARVLSGGVLRDTLLPPGLLLRPTATPLPLGPWSMAGVLPLEGLGLEPGGWLAVLRAPGREDQRMLFVAQAGEVLVLSVPLVPAGSLPAEFQRIPFPDGSSVLLLDREVTSAEYLEFLNDPATLSRVPPRGPDLRLVPRNRPDSVAGHWKRGADGLFALGPGWLPDWPVLGVSYEDAVEYASWRTARDRPLGGRGVYALPTLEEWLQAGGRDNRPWVCGSRMRPKWTKSCYARRRAYPEPGLRFPRDESPLGVFDMAGSVAEWTDDLYDRAQGTRRVAGGCWAWSKMDLFQIWGGQGWAPQIAGDETGFRLVLREAAR